MDSSNPTFWFHIEHFGLNNLLTFTLITYPKDETVNIVSIG